MTAGGAWKSPAVATRIINRTDPQRRLRLLLGWLRLQFRSHIQVLCAPPGLRMDHAGNHRLRRTGQVLKEGCHQPFAGHFLRRTTIG